MSGVVIMTLSALMVVVAGLLALVRERRLATKDKREERANRRQMFNGHVQ